MPRKRDSYTFNMHKLEYEKHVYSKKSRRIYLFVFSLISLSLAICIMIYTSKNGLHPEIKMLNQEKQVILKNIQQLSANYKEMIKKTDQIIQHENNLYRSVVELNRIPDNIYNPGFGGSQVNREPSVSLLADSLYILSKKLETKLRILNYYFLHTDSALKRKEIDIQCTPCIQPIAPRDLIRVGDGFKNRFHPILKYWRPHEGIDLISDRGKNIYAPSRGIVENVRYSLSFGNMLLIDHGNGIQTLYGHLSKTLVEPGDTIRLGDIIALVGSSGLSSGPHLHYEVHVNREPVDPLNYIHTFFNDSMFTMIIKNQTPGLYQ